MRSLSETLELIASEPTFHKRVALLKQHDNPILRNLLKHAFDPNIKFLLPPGEVKYNRSHFPGENNALMYESRKLYLFIEGGHPTLTQEKRERLFAGLLSNLSPKDADLMIAIKDKKTPYPNITQKLVERAWPEMFPTNAVV